MKIHPSAIIDSTVQLAADVEVGPYSVLIGDVRIGPGTKIHHHVSIGSEYGRVKIGAHNQIFPGAVVGGPPQDLKYKGEPTELVIGDNNQIREFATLNIGTAGGGGKTSIGNSCLLMAYVHIAHDCHIQDRVVIANNCQFAGHVEVDSDTRIGGVCCFSQFVRLGRFSYIAGNSSVNKDILPFSIAQGNYALMRATNKIGLERAGFSKDQIDAIHRTLRGFIMGNRTVDEAMEHARTNEVLDDEISYLLDFASSSKLGLAR